MYENKKKQSVAVAMVAAIGVSAMIPPMIAHAHQEAPSTVTTKETDSRQA